MERKGQHTDTAPPIVPFLGAYEQLLWYHPNSKIDAALSGVIVAMFQPYRHWSVDRSPELSRHVVPEWGGATRTSWCADNAVSGHDHFWHPCNGCPRRGVGSKRERLAGCNPGAVDSGCWSLECT